MGDGYKGRRWNASKSEHVKCKVNIEWSESHLPSDSTRGHTLGFSVKSSLPRSPMGSGCAAMSILVPQPTITLLIAHHLEIQHPPWVPEYLNTTTNASSSGSCDITCYVPFWNKAINLVTVIDPVSGYHTVCDLCDRYISLGIQVASKPLFNYWGADSYQKTAFKRDKKRGKRVNICELYYGNLWWLHLINSSSGRHWLTRG
jgi:hypothetical protein